MTKDLKPAVEELLAVQDRLIKAGHADASGIVLDRVDELLNSVKVVDGPVRPAPKDWREGVAQQLGDALHGPKEAER